MINWTISCLKLKKEPRERKLDKRWEVFNLFFFILRFIYRIQKCLVWMSNPHFHTPITSTRHFHISATPFKLTKSVTSTRHYFFYLRERMLYEIAKSLIKNKNLYYCRSDGFVLKWSIGITDYGGSGPCVEGTCRSDGSGEVRCTCLNLGGRK